MIASSTRTGTVEEGLAAAAHKIVIGTITTAEILQSSLKALTPTGGSFAAAFEIATLSNRKLARYFLRSMELAVKDEAEPWHIPNDDRSMINLNTFCPKSRKVIGRNLARNKSSFIISALAIFA
jgi:hypothetical protein